MAQTVALLRRTSRRRGRPMRTSTNESWTGRWSRAAPSPRTRRVATVAVLFGVVGLAVVHLSVGAAPEQESVSAGAAPEQESVSAGAAPEQESVPRVDACARPTWVAAWSAPPQA